MRKHRDPKLRAFIIWEPVIATDLRAPSTSTLARITDTRARQFWDRGRVLSKAMGEKDSDTIVWDVINVYDANARWTAAPPQPVFSDRPVVMAIYAAEKALTPR